MSRVVSAPVVTVYCCSFVKKYYLPYCAHLCMKCSFGISNFLEKDFPILLLSSISLHWLLIKAFLSLLAILWNSAFKWVYLSFSPLLLASLLFSAICKASSHNHFAFLHFFFLGMVLITASYAMLQTSVHSSSGTLLDLIPWIYIPRYIQIRALKKKGSKPLILRKNWVKISPFSFFIFFECWFAAHKLITLLLEGR